MKILNKYALLLGSAGLAAGSLATIALQIHAQSATPSPTDTPSASGTATSQPWQGKHGHAPMGGDGIVASINGTTIVMNEEADEGGASYTVDASNATVTKNGATGQLSDIKVGDKIFVQGTTSGMNVTATMISVGHPGGHRDFGKNDNDKETNDDGSNATPSPSAPQ